MSCRGINVGGRPRWVDDSASISEIGHIDYGFAPAQTTARSAEDLDVSRRRQTAYFQLDQLDSLAQRYRSREISMQQVCALVTDATGDPLKPSEKPVREYWEYQGIVWYRPPGRIPEIVSPEVESAILELAGHFINENSFG
jgi:hypothetical protein